MISPTAGADWERVHRDGRIPGGGRLQRHGRPLPLDGRQVAHRQPLRLLQLVRLPGRLGTIIWASSTDVFLLMFGLWWC